MRLTRMWTPFGEYLLNQTTAENSLEYNKQIISNSVAVHSSVPPWEHGNFSFQFALGSQLLNLIIKPNFSIKAEGMMYGKLFKPSTEAEEILPFDMNDTGLITNCRSEKKEHV
ncbi:unnamed protein product [Allacma fusca]|uniref:Uncharacterized protein n=1 Tax=Allacma fusca TaxID=39272 RepID=A0A8J2KNI2_9HEXA|nr:unnamed protein product [Allacma fusca]